MLAYLNFM